MEEHDGNQLEGQGQTRAKLVGDGYGNPVFPSESSEGFVPEHERFRKIDPADEEAEARIAAQDAHDRKLDNRRLRAFEREQWKWAMEESAWQKELDRLERARTGLKGASNMSVEPFDPISHTYRNTDRGSALKERDEATLQRAEARRDFLAAKQHSQPYNILTGEEEDRHNRATQ